IPRDLRYFRFAREEYALSTTHPHRPSPGPTRPSGRDPDLLQHRHQLRPISCLTWGDHQRHHPTASIDPDVDLRRPATTRASKTVINRLGRVPGGTVFPRTIGVD